MERNQSPFGIERGLTPELYDHYLAKARTERAEAIAAFLSTAARWLAGLAGRGQRGRSQHRNPAGLRRSGALHS